MSMIAVEIKGHILVIDDDKNVVKILERFLTNKNYKVTVADNGTDGLTKFKEEKPNLVLLDVTMPGMSGVETLREIKLLDPSAKVIMLTGIQEESVVKSCLDLGAVEYITKPFDCNFLGKVIESKLGSSLN